MGSSGIKQMAKKKATKKPADPPTRNWLFADISRTEAETVLQEWGSTNGLFLVRESGPIWVMSRIGRSDEDSELIVHRKISLTNGRYSMQSTRTAPKEFDSLDELVAYYQRTTFSDGTSLMTEVPKTNGTIQPVRQRYVNLGPGNTPIAKSPQHKYVNLGPGSPGSGQRL